jgi:aryl-alcohol dehydrogenase-like predicted oxidoreductase
VRGAVRERVFQTSKSAARSREGALADLDATLATMAVDHLDLWQIHDVRTARDLDRISSPGGALEAFVDARAAGKVRFIGVTGHHDPLVLTRAVKEWPVDAVLLPVNPVESTLGGFLDATLPAALAKGLAVIGMKVLGASHYVQPQAGVTAELLLRFALSQPITTVIVGCSRMEEVRTLAHAGRARMPLDAAAQRAIVDLFAPHARRLAYYRGTL